MTWQRRRNCTIPELFLHLVRERGDQEGVVYPFRGLRWTFRELDRHTAVAARALLAMGVKQGDRITLWAENVPEWIVLQIALARVGAILVTANTALRPPEIEYLLQQSESSMVIYSAGTESNPYPEAIAACRERLTELRHEVFLGKRSPGDGILSYQQFLERAATVEEEAVHEIETSLDPDDVINMQYTSGTTGFPKGVMLTHRNLVNNACCLGKSLSFAPGERLAMILPMFHCFGCVVGNLGALCSSVTLCCIDRFEPELAVKLIVGERCNIIYGVPTHFRLMLEVVDHGDYDLSSLRTGIMGGAPCPEDLVRRLMTDFHVPEMVAAYGLTECSPGVSINDPHDSVAARATTVGRPVDDEIEIRIVDPASGEVVGPELRGELQVRGHCVMRGYYNKPEETRAVLIEDGWLRTGDLAVRGQDGLLRIVGRLKEIIIRGGENVYPAAVEDALRGHPSVRDAAVFGVPCEIYGEEVRAAVLLHEGASAGDTELRAHLKPLMAGIKIPSRFHFVTEFPMTASGKVQKFELAEKYGQGG